MGIDLFLLMNCINRPFLFAVSSPTAQKKNYEVFLLKLLLIFLRVLICSY